MNDRGAFRSEGLRKEGGSGAREIAGQLRCDGLAVRITAFLHISGCDTEKAWKGSHMKDESEPLQQSEMRPAHPAKLRLSEWIWRPWYAKLWWAAIPIYWRIVFYTRD